MVRIPIPLIIYRVFLTVHVIDGMIIIWAQSNSPSQTAYGSDLSSDDMQFEKEYWKPRTTFRYVILAAHFHRPSADRPFPAVQLCKFMILLGVPLGSTSFLEARTMSPGFFWRLRVITFFSADLDRTHHSLGKCVSEIAEHNHYVQGVAWDPLNEYIATQSSDRSMHVYSVSTKSGTFEVHAVGKNSRIAHHHTRTPSSHSRSRMFRRESTASDTESVITTLSEQIREEGISSSFPGGSQHQNVPLTPATSIPSTPSQSMFPPPFMDKPSSRRSSFSGSNAPSSPALHARYARSPSPLPTLPAIRSAISSPSTWNHVRLYGDEGFTNFFRRLTFSPDGGLLMTPAGQFEDPSVIPGTSRATSGNKMEEARGRKGHPDAANSNSGSSVYIYSRANFARPPVAQLPGHKKASVAVRFSPILYELRPGVFGPDGPADTKYVVVEKGRDTAINVDVGGPPASAPNTPALSASSEILHLSPSKSTLLAPLALPAIVPPLSTSLTLPSPVLSATDSVRASSPAVSKPSTPAPPPSSASVFALPYRMLFAVATMDAIAIHDTQQAGPICLLTKLHYDEFTDMSWSVFHLPSTLPLPAELMHVP